jgi:hypothetical protein
MAHPSCFRPPSSPAQQRYLDLVQETDPLADPLASEVMSGRLSREQALSELTSALSPPIWVDLDRQRLGCQAFQRTGILGGLVLALYALPLGYLSPAGTKPLALSGRLVEQAPRRLGETNRFLFEVTRPGGMATGAPGFQITVKVRLMHAVARLHCRRAWRPQDWGQPINQAHMASTNLLFSLHCVDGLRKLGVRWSREQVQGYLHLWRHVGWTLGVRDELLCSTEAEARRIWSLVRSCEGAPDTDSRGLARALVEQAVPATLASLLPLDAGDPRLVKLLYRLSTALLGRETAALLGYPAQTGPLLITPLLRLLVGGVESVRHSSPRTDDWLLSLGSTMNERLAEATLDGKPAQFVA